MFEKAYIAIGVSLCVYSIFGSSYIHAHCQYVSVQSGCVVIAQLLLMSFKTPNVSGVTNGVDVCAHGLQNVIDII